MSADAGFTTAAGTPRGEHSALPTVEQVKRELARASGTKRRHTVIRNVVFALAAVFAASVLLSLFAFPLFRIYGSSMSPTLGEGDVVVADKPAAFGAGELVAFSYNNKTLAKRVIAGPGDWVDIDASGNVSVNGSTLEEPYLQPGAKSLGRCDISLPYQVPEGTYFVMGDRRDVSVDSRSSQVGCIPAEQIVGRLVFRIWPLSGFGTLR